MFIDMKNHDSGNEKVGHSSKHKKRCNVYSWTFINFTSYLIVTFYVLRSKSRDKLDKRRHSHKKKKHSKSSHESRKSSEKVETDDRSHRHRESSTKHHHDSRHSRHRGHDRHYSSDNEHRDVASRRSHDSRSRKHRSSHERTRTRSRDRRKPNKHRSKSKYVFNGLQRVIWLFLELHLIHAHFRSPEKIDKQKLLEIARKNAISLLKQGALPASVIATKDKIASIKAGGKTVDELTGWYHKVKLPLAEPYISNFWGHRGLKKFYVAGVACVAYGKFYE